jgi:hypothetical protein
MSRHIEDEIERCSHLRWRELVSAVRAATGATEAEIAQATKRVAKRLAKIDPR